MKNSDEMLSKSEDLIRLSNKRFGRQKPTINKNKKYDKSVVNKMGTFVVKGGRPLSGTIEPQGAKNEALQILCAVLLTAEPVEIFQRSRYCRYQ